MAKILCVPQRGIGDFVHTLPLIHSLRNAFKDCEIVIPVVDRRQEKDSRSLEKLCTGIVSFSYKPIDDDIEAKRISLYRGKDFPERYKLEAKERTQFEREMYEHYLNGAEYDLAIILRNFYIDTLSCPNQFSLRNIQKRNHDHVVDRNLRFAEILGIQKLFDFTLNKDKDELLENHFGETIDLPLNYMVFILGAGRLDKKWTEQGNKELARFCESEGYIPVLIGSTEDYQMSKDIETESAVNLITSKGSLLDLENFCKIALRAKAIIGPDTGLTHLSDAIGAKVIGLYGPTRPHKFAPYNNRRFVVSTNHTSKLMQDIKSKDVICKLEKILEN
ncbi:hypothetical protein COU56_01555 [Candidatus Pacearchaeota archaeon CG10_big_fil_rev_8_21_14_0_10_31_9]|nr:MAG: hypothetical protein AUJ62_00205 [Candidatus Pacearchaeota archaeon CG1_02_32_21]PIN95467.1 MAG: hypothetical protein COU56_01555 [Candidatus Pacearchaeota archaeon CG10_big_fil_rev_8_21_14_0_10_31_9]PIZ82906.1 MAG: hypothetical protein COX97_02460 [Candidatus Pacearchaeota archaeon CG_4_10_14_0_2_um_filter_05_32_18]